MNIDLRSDTFTQPTEAMRDIMRNAQVGDDVFGEDPSINALEHKVATLLGMEAAVFCPTATMCNQIAMKVLTRPMDEIICDRLSHIYNYEAGGYAFISGCSIRTVETERGMLQAADILENINPIDVHKPNTSLVCLENTCNKGGGAIYPYAQMQDISIVCKENHLKMHLDGSRLFNAWVETRDPLHSYSQLFDTITICLSKGLGCPAGAVLSGSKNTIQEARRIRKVLGGGMRQAGILASAGLYALEHHLESLKEDNNKARFLATVLERCGYIESILPVDSNIVILQLNQGITSEQYLAYLHTKSVLAFPIDDHKVRFVTHMGIENDMLPTLESVLLDYPS
jgi:threonine aldolase